MSTTWNPGFKSAGVTLSSGNLIAQFGSSASGVGATRAMTGKTYFEVTIGSTVAGTQAVGIANATSTLADLGTGSQSLGYQQNGIVLFNNATLTTIQTFAAGNTVCVAVDPIGQLIWFRVGSGNWNNSGTANPATGAGGISLSAYAVSGSLGPQYPAASGSSTSDTATGIFASGSFTQTPPSGFDPVDTAQISTFANGDVASHSVSFTQYGAAKKTTPSSENCVAGTQAQRDFGISNAWYGGVRLWSPAGTATHVSGNTKEGALNVSGRLVMAFDGTGVLLGSAKSDGSGNFSIPALGRSQVFAVAFDPANFQMIGYDRITPI